MYPNTCTYDKAPGFRRLLFHTGTACSILFSYFFTWQEPSEWGIRGSGVEWGWIKLIQLLWISMVAHCKGAALRQQRVILARLNLSSLAAGLLGHMRSPCWGSDGTWTTHILRWVFFFIQVTSYFLQFPLPTPLLPFSFRCFLSSHPIYIFLRPTIFTM